jgi:class 3 adenylate cyclase
MPLPKVIPALADLTQDIAGPIPVELLQSWATGAQDSAAAEKLLAAFQSEGTVVSSDTSGLSRMSRSMELLDVLRLVSQPKEIVHAIGREIGGRGIGIWVADNTEMLYPGSVSPETVIAAMHEVQARISERLQVRIGMCVHQGRFYEIGGGLYGEDADHVEYLAEHCAGPGEILLTESLARHVESTATGRLVPKLFGGAEASLKAWILSDGPRLPELAEHETTYPHPFPEEFYALLPQLGEPGLKDMIYSRWLRERVVVFLAREREASELASLGGLLDDLVINALMETVVKETAPQVENIASSAGGLAILTFATTSEAVGYARAVKAQLAENGVQVRVGIDAGPMLLFSNPKGPSGITGDPVNIASKLSEDVGRADYISISDRAAKQLGDNHAAERFEVQVSGVTLSGILVS